jgi:hypothetical protein
LQIFTHGKEQEGTKNYINFTFLEIFSTAILPGQSCGQRFHCLRVLQEMRHSAAKCLAVLSLLLLQACGGGGSDDTATPPPGGQNLTAAEMADYQLYLAMAVRSMPITATARPITTV